MSSNNSALVPTVSSLQSRIEGYPANGQGATTFTVTTPEGNTLTPFTLTNTTTGDWDSAVVAEMIRQTLPAGAVTGWNIENTAADNDSRLLRVISDSNRVVNGLWTISTSNSNGATVATDPSFFRVQAGGPARAAQTYTVTFRDFNNNDISSPLTITGPIANGNEAAQAIAALNPVVTGFTVYSDGEDLIFVNNVIGNVSHFDAAVPDESTTGNLFVTSALTVVVPEAPVTNAERVLTVTDDRGVDHDITIYGSKNANQVATFVANNLAIPGWSAAATNAVVTYTADEVGVRTNFTRTLTGTGGNSTLAVSVAEGTAGVDPVFVAPYPTVSTTPRDTDFFRGERIVTWITTEPAVSNTFTDYTFARFRGEEGEDGASAIEPDVIRTVELFQARTSEPTPPNFAGFSSSTGEASGNLVWTNDPPVPTAGQRLWSASREIIMRGGEDTWVRDSGWTVRPLSSSGSNGSTGSDGVGTTGARFASRTLYTSAALVVTLTDPAPSAPVATLNWATGAVTIAGGLWSETPPTVTSSVQGTIYVSNVIFYDPTGEEDTTDATGSAPTPSFNIVGAVSFVGGDFSLDGSTITTINGGNIATGSITAEQISADYAYVGELNADRITVGTIDIERLPGLAVGESLTYTDTLINTGGSNLTTSFDGVRAGTRFLLFTEVRMTNNNTNITEDLLAEFQPTGTNVIFDHSVASTVNNGRHQRFAGVNQAPIITLMTTGVVQDTSGTLGYNVKTSRGSGRLTGTVGFLLVRR